MVFDHAAEVASFTVFHHNLNVGRGNLGSNNVQSHDDAPTDRQADTHRDGETERRRDRHTDRQTDNDRQ